MSELERHDPDLERRFAAVRAEDAIGAPRYDEVRASAFVLGTRRRRKTRAIWAAGAAASVAAAALAVTLLDRRSGGMTASLEEIAIAEELSSWSAPTDELYGLASLEIPDSVPGLDLGSAYVPDAFAEGVTQSAAETPPDSNDTEVER